MWTICLQKEKMFNSWYLKISSMLHQKSVQKKHNQVHKKRKPQVSRLLFVGLNGAVRVVWLAVREPVRLSADGRFLSAACMLYKPWRTDKTLPALPAPLSDTQSLVVFPLLSALSQLWMLLALWWTQLTHSKIESLFISATAALSWSYCNKLNVDGSLAGEMHFDEFHNVFIMPDVECSGSAQRLLNVERMLLSYPLT